MRKTFIRLLKFVLIFMVILGVGILGFFLLTEAPILKGDIEFSLQYKEDRSLDVYLPTIRVYEKTPVVLFYHGGAWLVGRKESVNNARFNTAFNVLREKGYAIVSPEYTLGKFGKSPFPACITDAFDALEWIKQNQEKYNFDLNNVGLFGESAGAHLALMVAFSDAEKFNATKTQKLKYLVDIYGPTDLNELYLTQKFIFDSIESVTKVLPDAVSKRINPAQYLFGFNPNQDSSQTKLFTELFSPQCYIDKSNIPVLIVHGESDRLVPISQSILLEEYFNLSDIPNRFYKVKGMDHGFINATKEQKSKVQKWIVEFILDNYHSE